MNDERQRPGPARSGAGSQPLQLELLLCAALVETLGLALDGCSNVAVWKDLDLVSTFPHLVCTSRLLHSVVIQ